MRLLPLSNSTKFALIDDEDFDRCGQYTWFVQLNDHLHESIHARVDGVNNVPLARFILHDFTSSTIDHRDRDSYNNQKSNLRSATHSQNARNRSICGANTSGYKGVTFRKDRKYNKWAAGIRVNNKQKHLGFFATKEEAALAYNKAATKYWGEWAYLNEIKEN